MIRHKFNAVATEINGIRFGSRREARYYSDLLLAKKSGELLFFLRQAPLHLPGNVRYVVDFVEFWKNGEVRFVDCKGYATPMYKLKKTQAESVYPITILEA